MERLPAYSRVRIASDRYASEGAPRGAVGYVVELYDNGYEVEVSDVNGTTLFLGSIAEGEVELAPE